jgi:PKD repeat protein
MKKIIPLSFLLLLICFAHGEAKIEADKLTGCAPLAVNFTALDNEADAKYSWDFGNGYTSDKKEPSVVFLKGGVYQVNLVVNSRSGVKTFTTTVTAFEAPKADFTIEKSRACVNEELNFKKYLFTFNH